MPRNLMRIGIRSHEALSLAFALIVVLLIAFLSYRSWAAFDRRTSELKVAEEVSAAVDGILSSLKDAETGERGFLLTGEDDYLEPYVKARVDVPVLLKRLEKVASERPEQGGRIEGLKPLITERFADFEQTIQLRRNDSLDDALAVIRTGRGKAAMDRIRAICSDIQRVTNQHVALYSERADSNANDLGLIAVAGSASLFLLLILATLTIQQGIERRQHLIEDLRKSEQRARESRDWLNTTLHSIGDGVIVTDAKANITLLNGVAESLTGWTQEQAAGASIQQVFAIQHEENGTVVESPVLRALSEGVVTGLANHTKLVSRDGRHIPIDDSAAPIRDGSGEVKGAVLVFRDISQRREAERKVQRSMERVRALIDANPIGVVVGDIYGGIYEANDAFLAMTGYTREELVNGAVSWKEIAPTEQSPLGARAVAEAQQNGACTPYETEYVRKDGSRLPVYAGFALLGEWREESVAFILDLTRRKKQEEERAQQFRRLVESNIIGIVVANEQRVIEANDSYLRMVGHSRSDLMEGRVDWSRATSPKFQERNAIALREFRERGSCTPFEKEYVHRDGTHVPVLIGGAVLSYEPEFTWICYVVDLGEQKAMERELRLANQRLSEANEELRSFAYIAAHDLKSPLRTIWTTAETLWGRIHEKSDREAEMMSAQIQSSAAQMSALISDLLDYSTVASDVKTATEPVDCASLFAFTVMNLQSQIRAAGAKVTSDPLPRVKAGTQLVRVFQNVIENALKYRSEKRPEIQVSAKRNGDEWIISIRDNGIGFEMQHADRIFGVFKRLHGPGEYEGTGIGLAICRKTVERYGGRMWAESEPGAGSTFYFSLPAVAGAAVGSCC
jgi:PAS domain S-box-containing protein